MADYVFDQIGGLWIFLREVLADTEADPAHSADRLPQVYYTLNRLSVETGAFRQLTRKYMTETFNPNTPDVDDVRYVSFLIAMCITHKCHRLDTSPTVRQCSPAFGLFFACLTES